MRRGCHALYCGKATRHLITRCREHLGINKAGQKMIVSLPQPSGTTFNKSGHAAWMVDFSVLDRANNVSDVLIHEIVRVLITLIMQIVIPA